MSKQYADVAPFIPLPAAKPQCFTYHIPPEYKNSVQLYSLVNIPWRRRHVKGLILNIHSKKVPYKTKALKPAAGQLTSRQVEFIHWIATTAQGGLGYTARLFLPTKNISPPVPLRGISRSETRGGGGGSKSVTAISPRLITKKIREVLAKKQKTLIITAEKWRTEDLKEKLPASLRQRVAIIHSDQSPAARKAVIAAAISPRAGIIIGTQKALFLPLINLGLIVIDHEEWPAHKLWDQYPLLDNRYAAETLTGIHSCPLLYTSDFPSIRLRYLIQQKVVKKSGPEPKSNLSPEIIPLSFQDRRDKHVLPLDLVKKLRRWHRRKSLTLLFINQDTKPIKHFLKKKSPPPRSRPPHGR